jgi:preprotein translocase subunit YajC
MSSLGDSGQLTAFLPFALILAIFYVLILMPMQRRQKKVQEFQGSLKVGDKIVTTGGIYGQITRVNDKSVQLQIADKVRIEIARASVGGYQGQEPIVPDAANS